MSETDAGSPTPDTERAEPRAPQPTGWYPEPSRLFDPRRKSPLVAAFLSLMPGLGQIYIGFYSRGFVIAGSILLILMFATTVRGNLEGPMIMAVFFAWLFNIVDAGRMAALYSHAAAGGARVDLPEDFKMPRIGGSMIGGTILVVFGGIALSNTLFDLPLRWLEDWWPVFPLALGAYLLVRGVMDWSAQRQIDEASPESYAGGSE